MDLPIASLDAFRASPGSGSANEEARKVAQSLIDTGAVIIRDSRASADANSRFLDLFEDYFAQPDEVLRRDERPEVGYQVGVTLENTEKPRCGSDEECLGIIKGLEEGERPLDISGHGADPKCRFFHKMAVAPPYTSRFPISEISNVTPTAFEQTWPEKVKEWGEFMKQAVEGVAQMLAVGLGMPADEILEAGRYGSHLLAPTATNLVKYGHRDTCPAEARSIFAGFHSDLNFLTIHGQSRYPGLHIWARNSGKRIPVKIPPGCLLVQAGKQLEWMTGGLIKGYSCCDGPEEKGVSSTAAHSHFIYFHYLLRPLPSLRKEAEDKFGPQKEYGEMYVGDQVRRELGLIALMASDDA